MTPKEKAEQLLDKFKFASIYFTNGFDGAKLNAKTCALFAVDELIEETSFEVPNIRQRYWKEVKQEIEKL
jgi:crotonobetainyl-CoA:carnitine CoA-transferase CaiB-like acyl-CoA transferase